MGLDANLPFLDARSMSEDVVVRQLTDRVSDGDDDYARTLQHCGVSSGTDLFCDGDAASVVRRRRLSIVAGAERLTTVTTWISNPK